MKSNTIKLIENINNNLNEAEDYESIIKQYEDSGKFNKDQMKQIRQGFEKELTLEQVSIYAKPEFDDFQMYHIRHGFEKGLTPEQISIYAKPEFSYKQMYFIKNGFIDGLTPEQISIYVKPEFNGDQMEQIVSGFENGLTMEQIAVYAKPEFNKDQMYHIRRGFENGLTMEQIAVYAKPEFNSDQMYEMRKKLINSYDDYDNDDDDDDNDDDNDEIINYDLVDINDNVIKTITNTIEYMGESENWTDNEGLNKAISAAKRIKDVVAVKVWLEQSNEDAILWWKKKAEETDWFKEIDNNLNAVWMGRWK